MPKLGCITGSRFSDMMTGGRGGAEWGKTSDKLAIRLAAERLGLIELNTDGYESDAMRWGTEQEELALLTYEQSTMTEVHGMQDYQQHDDYEHVGCTPDGLIGERGLLEIKNPETENHLLHVINGDQVDQYLDQIQGSLWVTSREYCDFVSYDSRIDNIDLSINITTVERDQEYIDQMEERYNKFEEIIQEYVNQLKQIKNERVLVA